MISRTYILKSKRASKEVLEDQLRSLTGLYVSVTEITKDLDDADGAPDSDDSCEGEHEAWHVCFQSPSDNYAERIFYHREGNRIVICDSWKDLNRYPHYPFFATAAAIEDFGGEPQFLTGNKTFTKVLPEYSRLNFNQWKAMNGGTKPPTWKWLLLVGSISFRILGMLVTLPFKCLAELFRLRKTDREYKCKAAQVEALEDRKHLSRHFKSPSDKLSE